MLVLAMAALMSDEAPTVVLEQPKNVSELHLRTILVP
jgi:hypothetical protein